MKRILITGATGYIGQKLSNYLAEKKNEFEVHVIVRENSDISVLNSSIKIHKINNYPSIKKIFDKFEFKYVFHLATHYVHSQDFEQVGHMMDANIKFGTIILQSMIEQKEKNFINISSCAEFNEDGEESPNSLYSATKKSFRDIIDFYREKIEINSLTLFFYDTYGEDDYRKKVFSFLISKSRSTEPFDMSPGEQILYPIHISDVISSLEISMNVITSKENELLYFVPGPEGISLKEVSKEIEVATKGELNANWGELPYRLNENLSPYVGRKLPGWVAKIKFKEGVKKIL